MEYLLTAILMSTTFGSQTITMERFKTEQECKFFENKIVNSKLANRINIVETSCTKIQKL